MNAKETIKDLKKMGVKQFAKTTKSIMVSIDDRHPIALHDWLKIPKGTLVGMITEIREIEQFQQLWTMDSTKVQIYAPNGYTYHPVTIPYEYVKVILEK
jgi:hypothetical protein